MRWISATHTTPQMSWCDIIRSYWQWHTHSAPYQSRSRLWPYLPSHCQLPIKYHRSVTPINIEQSWVDHSTSQGQTCSELTNAREYLGCHHTILGSESILSGLKKIWLIKTNFVIRFSSITSIFIIIMFLLSSDDAHCSCKCSSVTAAALYVNRIKPAKITHSLNLSPPAWHRHRPGPDPNKPHLTHSGLLARPHITGSH